MDHLDFTQWKPTVPPELQLKPCPFCKSKDVYTGQLAKWYVGCDSCLSFGSAADTRWQAIELWNAVPRQDDITFATCTVDGLVAAYEAAMDEKARLKTRVAELEDALKPFAAQKISLDRFDCSRLWDNLYARDFRIARTVYNKRSAGTAS